MTAAQLMVRLTDAGFEFDGAGGSLRVRPPAGRALTAEEWKALRQHKEAILDLLAWPPECWHAEALYHRPPVLVAPHARLFPLLGRRVLTPQGPGRLLAARLDGCPVALDADPSRAVDIPWQDVRPA